MLQNQYEQKISTESPLTKVSTESSWRFWLKNPTYVYLILSYVRLLIL